MKKEDAYFLSAIGICLLPYWYMLLKGIPMYNGRHDETFYSLVAVKLFVLLLTIACIFIFYYAVTAFIQRRAYRIVVIFGILMAFNWLLITTESEGDRQFKRCFFSPAPGKCGDETMTEEAILNQLNELGLSKRKARQLFLEAQKENQEFLDYGYKYTTDLDTSDKERERRRALSRELLPYYDRALRAVERMGD